MPSDDEDERGPGSEAEESENENENEDETMRDDGEEDAVDEGDDGDSSSASDDESDTAKPQDSQANADDRPNSSSPHESPPQQDGKDGTFLDIPLVRPEALSATTYDIVPTIAAPQATSINTVTATADMRWVFSGGSDGYIRKFNWADSVNGKLMLTVAQKHPFVDSVQKAGVLMTYWENWDIVPRDEERPLSSVYSLAAQRQGLWLLSGLESGGIRLQSIRHDEGKEIAVLQKHTSAVSALQLASDEHSLLSGSWDKTVLDWDLNTGKVRSTFGSSTGHAGQISAIEFRPESSLPVPPESGEAVLTNGTFSTNPNPKDSLNSTSNGVGGRDQVRPGGDSVAAAPSPTDSLFGGDDADDDLFGDAGGSVANGTSLRDAFGEDDDEFSRAIADGPKPVDEAPSGDIEMSGMQDQLQPVQPPDSSMASAVPEGKEDKAPKQEISDANDKPMVNGLLHAEDTESSAPNANSQTADAADTGPKSDSTFLSSSIDGTIRVWDRRQSNPVAKIVPRNTPPWCMNACWSPDGNMIYAGRRNGTVEEYSLHKGLRSPERVFKFPQGSGAVTSVKAMPNGRHLICASHDILRLYDLKGPTSSRSTVPFLIVPGHRTGVVSQLYIDPACRFMISTGGNRGWEGQSTEVLLGYEIGCIN